MLLAICLTAAIGAGGQDVAPKLDQLRLVAQGHELAPMCAFDGGFEEHACGDWRVRVSPCRIAIARADAASAAREFTIQDRSFVAGDAAIAYFADPRSNDCSLLRLDLSKGEWLDSFSLSDARLHLDEQSKATPGYVAAALLDGTRIFVVRHGTSAEGCPWGQCVNTYAVACLDAKSGEVRWARKFAVTPAPAGATAYLLAPMRTGPNQASVRALQVFEDQLLVCCGEREPLQLLDRSTGREVWKLERVWEFQRGYVGPSVWQHFMGRFGIEARDLDEHAYTNEGRSTLEQIQREFDKRRAAFDAAFIGSIAAGPFIVSKPNRWGEPGSALIVFVALSTMDQWVSFLGQCLAYEIDSSGNPISVVALPRMPRGGRQLEFDDHVVIACERGAMACVAPSDCDGDFGMMAGNGPDAVGRVQWYREPSSTKGHAWLTCDPAGDPVAMNSSLCVRVADGAWLGEARSHVLHFPLSLVDPRNGAMRAAELRVPFEGEIELPTTNFSSSGGTTHAVGWLGLALMGMEFADGRLRLTLGNVQRTWTLEFDVSALTTAK